MLRPAFFIVLWLLGALGTTVLVYNVADTFFPSHANLLARNDSTSCGAPVFYNPEGNQDAYAFYTPGTGRFTLTHPALLENHPLRRAVLEHECGHYAGNHHDPDQVGLSKGGRLFLVATDALLSQQRAHAQENAADCYAGKRLREQADFEAIDAFAEFLRERDARTELVAPQHRWVYRVSHPSEAKRLANFLACAGVGIARTTPPSRPKPAAVQVADNEGDEEETAQP